VQGLQAYGHLQKLFADRVANIAKSQGLPRIIGLLEILHIMSELTELTTICSTGYQPVAAQLEIERLRQACAFINDHAHQALTRDNVAKVVHMSSSGFSRFSKAHTGKTFPEFVADIRVSRASQRLASTDLSITKIALQCGFKELSTINRAFKRYRDATLSHGSPVTFSYSDFGRVERLTQSHFSRPNCSPWPAKINPR
jgi:AraC-like DNA-binding protein